MRIYLDTCCLNRPYDDQGNLRISLETQAVLYIQECIKANVLALTDSYILQYENNKNPHPIKRDAIKEYLATFASTFVDVANDVVVKANAEKIMGAGLRPLDAYHVACAIFANCNYFITTDDKILKYKNPQITIFSPISFIGILEEL